MPELVDDAPARALAIYAHPNDPEISCGGTLARWADAGCDVHVLVCARGEKGSTEIDVDTDVLARTRAEEMAAAGAVLGVRGREQLELDDGAVENTAELRGRLVEAIRRLRPDVVVCPDPTAVFFGDRYFNHRDHRQAGWAVLDAIAPAAGNPHYFPDAGAVHNVGCAYLSGTLEPNAWVDVTTSIERKIDALLCHRSQLGETGEWFRDLVHERAEEGGRAAGVRYAEGFRRLAFGP